MEVNIERIGAYTIEEIRALYLQQQSLPNDSDGDDDLTEYFLIEAIVQKSIRERALVTMTVADFLGPDRMKALVEANAENNRVGGHDD